MEQRNIEQRYAIKFCVKLGDSVAETYDKLVKVFGDEALSRAQAFRWHNNFKNGRESVGDEPRSGRPVEARTDNVQRVRTLVRQDRRLTVRMLADELNLKRETVRKILTDDLSMKKLCTKMVPKNLLAEQKHVEMSISQDCLEQVEADPTLLDRVITGDEGWYFQYDPETKRQSQQWLSPGAARPKKARMSKSKVKTMMICFFDKGIVHKEFVPPGQTVNQHFYLKVLDRLRKRVIRVRPEIAKTWILHHDNAPCHRAFSVSRFLTSKNIAVLPQAPYSPDMSPCDFFLFPQTKLVVKGTHFESITDIQNAVTRVLQDIPVEAFQKCYESWKKRWNQCIATIRELFVEASVVEDDDTPRRRFLKRGVSVLSNDTDLKSKKIKMLNQTIRRQRKIIVSLKCIISSLKDNNLINEDTSTLLLDNFGENKHLISRLAKKNARITPTKKYCPELRRFAISLHFRSVSAYNFVRKEFNTILPHPRTLGKWYSNINCESGFTTEALNTLALKCRITLKPVYCALVMDEMAVRQHVEWDGTNYHGYVNVGESICNETMEKAKEALVFLVVALNEAWKIPVGYFLINHINSSQKSELVSHCIDVLTKTGVTIVSLTFDGCPTNINMVKILGCGLYADNFNTSFKVDGVANTISIIPDPAHMVKLIRNAFGEKRQFIDMDGGVIDFEYINKLLILQEDEGCHLANKLKKQHVFYSRQKMKVKLATQLLSRSVSEALTFCRDKLELPAFKDSGLIKFIKYFNDAFDILNSRSINQYGKSKAICKKNIIEIKEFYEEFSNYIKKLKLVENKNGQITHVLILKSARKNGFLGFLICFESLNSLYNNYLMPDLIDYICFYKLSQDHIELFFGTIRSHGGHNDNPTARQFRSAYRKLLINAKIKDGSLGNCIPLDEIDILNCSSATNAIKDPVDIINESNAILYKDIILQPQTHHIKDHDYIIVSDQNITMSNYIKEVVAYISGFICHRLSSKIKCDICCNALFGDKKDFMTSLINVRDKGGLSYPSDDVILIALQTEKFMKSYSSDTKPLNKMVIVFIFIFFFFI
ncbi:hypothetical protein QTP88_011171 [Uroleucon formosanum]